MTRGRENLIKDLVADLRPVQRPGRIVLAMLAWLAFAAIYSTVVTAATGPLRPGALANLALPTFALETLVAATAIVALAWAALASAIPGAPRRAPLVSWPLVAVAIWAGIYVVGFWYPAHPVSTLGERAHCVWQAMLFAVPNLALMLWLARRLFPLEPVLTGALAGGAAAAIPSALMQFFCMYVPGHILTHHLGPILATAVAGALVGKLALTKRTPVPRSRDVSVH